MYNLRNACHTSLKLDAALTTQARSYVTHATHVTHVTCVPHVIDTAPTTQMITAGGFYLIPTYDHGHVVLAVLASVGVARVARRRLRCRRGRVEPLLLDLCAAGAAAAVVPDLRVLPRDAVRDVQAELLRGFRGVELLGGLVPAHRQALHL